MAQNIKELYLKLNLSSKDDANSQVVKIEQWIFENISTDYASQEPDLSLRLNEYQTLLSDYFTKRHFSLASPDFLTFAVSKGMNLVIDCIKINEQQLSKSVQLLNLAAAKGHLSTVNSLLAKGIKPSADSRILHDAILLPIEYSKELRQRKEEIVKILAAANPKLMRVLTGEGNSVFHAMAENNFADLISFYLAPYADLAKIENKMGHYPLTLAILNKHFDALNALLALEGLEQLSDIEGRIALHYAAEYGDLQMISCFIDKSPSAVNKKDSHGRTPLHFSCLGNNLITARALLKNGADENAVDQFQRSVLHYAASNNNSALVELLLNQPQISINTKDSEGKTALDYASDEAVRTLLIDKGAIATVKKPDNFAYNLRL